MSLSDKRLKIDNLILYSVPVRPIVHLALKTAAVSRPASVVVTAMTVYVSEQLITIVILWCM